MQEFKVGDIVEITKISSDNVYYFSVGDVGEIIKIEKSGDVKINFNISCNDKVTSGGYWWSHLNSIKLKGNIIKSKNTTNESIVNKRQSLLVFHAEEKGDNFYDALTVIKNLTMRLYGGHYEPKSDRDVELGDDLAKLWLKYQNSTNV
jgi:hypothetical protein